MSSARLVPSPSAGSSSLDQKVPSKNTQSAVSSARRTVVGHRADPRQVGQGPPGRALADPEPDAVLGVRRGAGLEVERQLARHRQRLDQEAGRAAIEVGQLFLFAEPERAPA